MEAIDKKNKKAQKVKALNKSQPSLLQVLDMPMISKEKEEKDTEKPTKSIYWGKQKKRRMAEKLTKSRANAMAQ